MEFKRSTLAALAAGMACLSVAVADTYRWKDKDGKTHYGSVVPPEYADQPYDVLNSQGLVIRHVENTTRAPQAVAEQKTEDRKPLISEEERRRQTDRLLLIQFDSEADIQEALELEIAQLGYDSKLVHQSFESTRKAIRDQVRQAAHLQRANLPVSEDFEKGMATLYARRLQDQRRLLVLQKREDRIRERYMDIIERYRTLTSKAGNQETATDRG